mgnify:CR=1 FL=1
MLQDLQQARIVITNYHAFKLREKLDLSKGTRSALEGWRGEALSTLETEGEMLQRVMPELMNLKRVMVINDEAHHCYREKPNADEVLETELGTLTGTEKTEARNAAKENREAARLWISGLEILQRKLNILRIFDLSATPFFLSGSGYVEGTLFPWTMSDFSLMDAIECGIVKLPRVPVADNIPGNDLPMFRNLWEHIRKDMPKKGKNSSLDPLSLPTRLLTALDAFTGIMKRSLTCGKKRIFPYRPVSSSSATTRPHRSLFTTTSPAFTERMRTVRGCWKMDVCRCSAILTTTANRWRGRIRC